MDDIKRQWLRDKQNLWIKKLEIQGFNDISLIHNVYDAQGNILTLGKLKECIYPELEYLFI